MSGADKDSAWSIARSEPERSLGALHETLRELRAQAWDEGLAAATDFRSDPDGLLIPIIRIPRPTNPYRKGENE